MARAADRLKRCRDRGRIGHGVAGWGCLGLPRLDWHDVFTLPSGPVLGRGTEMNKPAMRIIPLATFLALSIASGAGNAVAQDSQGANWSEVKCSRYKKAWSEALARRGREGLGQEFIARHEAFLASACTSRADVCPRTAEELDLANVLTILAMNAGTASTFLPFACRK